MTTDHDALEWLRVPCAWASDLSDLPPLAFGIHARLMLVSARRGPLPADHVALARLAGAHLRDFTRVWPTLSEHWTEHNGRVTCAHVEAERERMRSACEALRAAGRLGAAQRWSKKSTANRDSVDGLPIAHPSPSHDKAIGNGNGHVNGVSMALDSELEGEVEAHREAQREAEDPDSALRAEARRAKPSSHSVRTHGVGQR